MRRNLTDFTPSWEFAGRRGGNDTHPGADVDPLFAFDYLHVLYFKTDRSYCGRNFVPVLWDKQQRTRLLLMKASRYCDGSRQHSAVNGWACFQLLRSKKSRKSRHGLPGNSTAEFIVPNLQGIKKRSTRTFPRSLRRSTLSKD